MRSLTFIVFLFLSISIFAQSRTVIPFNENWDFYFAYNFERNAPKQKISIPHTWNTDEILQGVMEYKRTAAYYENTLQIKDEWKNKRVFLKFEGANSVADVFVNRKFINRHKGGYTAFTVEITDYIKSGNNNILVMVSNAYRHDVLPLHDDFNVYGGLHRPVSVIVTEKNCISPLDFGSSGVYVTPDKITQQSADIHINTKLSLQKNSSGITVKSSILDGNDKTITSTQNTISNLSEVNHLHTIKSPILWNGKKNPYLYKA